MPTSSTSNPAQNAALLLADDWGNLQLSMDQELAQVPSATMILAKCWRENSSNDSDNISGLVHHPALNLAEDWSNSDYGDIDSNDSGNYSVPREAQQAQ